MDLFQKKFYIPIVLLLIVSSIKAQQGSVGVGTNNPQQSAILDVTATSKGVLLPRVNLKSVTDQTTIANPVQSLLVFNINPDIVGGDGMGFYFWSGPTGNPANTWIFIGKGGSSSSGGGAQTFTGTGAPANTLGNAGDLYLDNLSGDYYQKDASGAWVKKGNLKGPNGNAGITGIQGGQGAPGVIGSTVISNNTNVYVDSSSQIVYMRNPGDSTQWIPTNNAAKKSLKGDSYILVTGGDNAVLKDIALTLNTTGIARDSSFIANLTTTNQFKDSVSNLLQNNSTINTNITKVIRDSTTAWYTNNATLKDSIINTITNSTVVNNDITKTVRDSSSVWYNNNTFLQDSIFNTVKAKADSLTGDKFITVTGGNGATLVNANTSLNVKGLANDSSFVNNLVTNNQFKDSVTNVVINNPTVNNNITKVIKDSTTEWFTNNTTLKDSIINTITNSTVVNNDITKTVRDSSSAWYTNNIVLQDSIFNTVKAKADTLSGDKFIKITGGNGATLVNANSSLDVKALAGDSSFITNLTVNNQFKDSVAQYSTDTAMLAGTGITINRSASGNTISANGSMNITMQASNYTVSSTDNVILVDASTGNVTVSVPTALAVKGRTYIIKRVDAVNANTVIIDFAGNHIDNATDTQISVGAGVTYQIINFSSSQWYTISRF